MKKILQQGTYIQNHAYPFKGIKSKTNRVIKRIRLKRIRRNIGRFWGLVDTIQSVECGSKGDVRTLELAFKDIEKMRLTIRIL